MAISTMGAQEVGTPWTGAQGVRERTSAIVARQAHSPERPHSALPRRKLDFQNLLPNPDSPDVLSSPPPDNSLSATTASPQTLGTSFLAATLADTSAFPPDTMGTVGPAQLIIALNGRIRSFNKNTGVADGVLNFDSDVFFQSVMTPPASNNFTSDPRIRYDRLSRRWFITIIDVPGRAGSLPNRVLLAVSDGSIITPSTVWTYFFFRQDQVSPAGDSGNFADYPTLGIDANALYIGVNIFGTRGRGSFSSTTAFVVRKTSVLGAGPIVVTAFRGLVTKVQGVLTGPYTPQGVDNYDSAATEGYIIGADPSYVGRINLRRISNPGGTPTISGNVIINVPANGGTITVPHLGNTGGSAGNLDGLDVRLIAAHLRNGRLWTTANLAVDNNGSPSGTDTRNGVRWYELQGIATGQTPSVVQSGTVFQPSPGNTTDQRHYWMGSVIVSGQGHAAMGFSVAGANERINAGTVGRLAGDPLGTMRTPQLYTASSSAYNPPSDPGSAEGRRWGDYSYTALDPDDDMTMWTIQEFCNAENSYGCQVAKLFAPAPATPASCNPASIAAGSNNVTVTVTGTSTNGSGFFDPGAGFSNRIAAAFSGFGITVNSIQYTDPAHLTLHISAVANASSGGHTLTITNPDGQAASSASSILTVIGGNNPPTISAIGNQTILEDSATAALGFTVGDVETPAASLILSAASSNTNLVSAGGIIFGGSGANRTVTITPAPDQFGSATITISVTDSSSSSSSSSFLLTVTPVNDPPLFTKGADPTVLEDAGLQTIPNWATAVAPGPANESAQLLNFIVANDHNSLFAIQPAIAPNGTLTFTPATNANGSAIVTVQLHDNGGASNGGSDITAPQSFTITVLPLNDSPQLAPIADRVINEGETLTITNIASDVDTPLSSLTFALVSAPAGAQIDASTGIFTWTTTDADGPSTNTILVVVTDNGSPSLSATQSFKVVVNELNAAPVLAPIADQTIGEGATLSFTASATDADLPTNVLIFMLAAGPPGAQIDASTGIFTWATTEADGPSTNTILVVVSDNGSPSLSATQSFKVIVNEVNTAPVLVPIADRMIYAGQTLTITNSATDSDLPANQLSYSLSNAPAGASIGTSNGIFTWTPAPEQARSTNEIAVMVTDDGSPIFSDSRTFSVTVLDPPSITISLSDTNVVLTWPAIANSSYRMQYKSVLGDANWTDLPGDVTAATNTATKIDVLGADPQRFYRLLVLP